MASLDKQKKLVQNQTNFFFTSQSQIHLVMFIDIKRLTSTYFQNRHWLNQILGTYFYLHHILEISF